MGRPRLPASAEAQPGGGVMWTPYGKLMEALDAFEDRHAELQEMMHSPEPMADRQIALSRAKHQLDLVDAAFGEYVASKEESDAE